MKNKQPPTYKGKTMGTVIVTALQILIGIIHILFGLLLATGQPSLYQTLASGAIYSIYTTLFGVATTIFAFGIWRQTKTGLIGTLATSIFVIIADSLTILNLPSIPGIPKFAAAAEITYSLIIITYLLKLRLGNPRP